jgi:peptidoglycan/xylan/chitin deacetylase (PgdA/CDA1 family)
MMARALKQSFKRQLSSRLVWPAVSRWFGQAAVVLAYHRVGPPEAPFRKVTIDNFRAQMAWLRRHCHLLHPSELRGAVEEPSRRCRVMVTFDDGYCDYFEHALPILREFDVPAVNFVATQFVDDGAPFWWDQVDLACQRTRKQSVVLPWRDASVPAATADDRMRIYRECQRHLKTVPDAGKTALLPRVFEALDVDQADVHLPRQVMTWEQMRASRDVTTFGGHLHSHPLVSRIDTDQLERELQLSHQRMTTELGARPTLFAYPDGDVTDAAKAAVRRHGYHMAFGIVEGLATPHSDWYEIARLTGPATVADLAWRIVRLHRGRGAAALPL